jgi:hypothetical protein
MIATMTAQAIKMIIATEFQGECHCRNRWPAADDPPLVASTDTPRPPSVPSVTESGDTRKANHQARDQSDYQGGINPDANASAITPP